MIKSNTDNPPVAIISLSPLLHRQNNVFEKYFTIEQWSADPLANSSRTGYREAAADFNGAKMRGLPFAGMMRMFSFCVAPGDFTIHAMNAGGDAWWGGGYTVVVNGATVVSEEMHHSTKQSSTFSVSLPPSSKTNFVENAAPRGGGGSVFWTDAPPAHIESYRNESDSDSAMYGDFIATPSRALSTSRSHYAASSGLSMRADPVVVDLLDE